MKSLCCTQKVSQCCEKLYLRKKEENNIKRHLPMFTKQGKLRSVYILPTRYMQLLYIIGKIKISSYRKRTAGNQKH